MGCDRYDPEVLDMETELEAAIQFEEQSTNFSLKDVINDKTDAKNTRRLILCFLIQFFQQFTGINVIAQMAPTAIANTGWRIYLLFCVMLFLSIPFTFFLLPETNGKTLEEIDFIFAKGEAKASNTSCVEMNVTTSEDKQGVERHESICISAPVAA
ncbi:hypothetical protein SLS56_009955 [Neofusicoccum ribis]|uniref:Major facilitator superfamily (MFS) profile domain-containing protein n=1 Tax=Neofusicoccum ribis TaxID=45134 RepID=A0ABR3SGB9_9PEZI